MRTIAELTLGQVEFAHFLKSKTMSLKDDWLVVLDLACEYTNYVIAGDEVASKYKKKHLVAELKKARRVYGDVPIVISTLAEYTSNVSKKLNLLNEAFELNVEGNNYNEALSCANSALRTCIDEKLVSEIASWFPKVDKFSKLADDTLEIADANELLRK